MAHRTSVAPGVCTQIHAGRLILAAPAVSTHDGSQAFGRAKGMNPRPQLPGTCPGAGAYCMVVSESGRAGSCGHHMKSMDKAAKLAMLPDGDGKCVDLREG